ncbi:MAG TPA: helix-turn-helix domain-containing protein [Acidobacteriaceae bacterium]|jgi:TetR/AcrR family transcriptional regulator|nr:helix-turn-helix domain-containing protein [Acidobacteriaceae bacterium]
MQSIRHQLRADQTRKKILQAAIREFSEHGLAGARTGAIASAAAVNKALLYYYFRDKEALYTAALEEVAGKVAGDALAVLDLDCSPGERMVRFALQHFDRILCQQGFQALMQQEMMRFRQGQGHAMGIIAKKAFEPMFARVQATAEAGMLAGELCAVDWMQMMYSALGANVFYFLSAPVVHLTTNLNPLDPIAIVERRSAAIEFLGQAIFTDRRRGARIAKAVLAAVPMPEIALPERKTA